jgi:nucleoside-diphosphate-sugar epimerase
MILITGGTGFIGKYFVSDAIQKGYNIRLLTRSEKAKTFFPSIEVFKGDATKIDTLRGISKDIDIVVHMAGTISLNPEENFLENKVTTENIVKVCKNVEKIVYTSSADAFGPIIGVADENYPCKPNNPYGASKIQAENIILKSGIPSIMFRPTIVYGIGSPWWKYGMSLLKFGFIPDTEFVTQVVHVKDVSNALMIGIKRGRGIYIIADSNPVKIVDMFAKVVRLLGKTPRKVPLWLIRLATTILMKRKYFEVALTNRAFSIKKAETKLKWHPKCDYDIEMKNMVDWYKNLNKNKIVLN